MTEGDDTLQRAPVRPGDVIADKYMVIRVLASGGMGVVVAARHRQLGRMVAIKFLREGMASRSAVLARFEREARIVAGLNGEHVAQVFDVGRLETGEPYIVMELLEGETLGDRIRRLGKLPVSEAVSFILQACEGLAQAHAAGVIHRDLKPANLFVCSRADGSDAIKILDFGISKTRDASASITHTMDTIGTPAYMAPEQLEAAGSVDVRADVWSLGAVLYEALSGRLPFEAEGLVKTVSSVILTAPTPLAEHEPGAPPALVAHVHRCLAKDPEQRFESVVDLARALAPFAPGDSGVSLARIENVAHRSSTPSMGAMLADASSAVRISDRLSAVATRMSSTSSSGEPATRTWARPSVTSRRRFLGFGVVAGAGVALGGGLFAIRRRPDIVLTKDAESAVALPSAIDSGPPLRVGVLHSLTGTMASSEAPLVDAALLAITRVNAEGGLLGRRVEAIVRDGRSHADTFVEEARRLLDEDGVPVVFGCWTSTSRRAVRPVFEERGKLLVYSVQYEGLESSPAILYLGAAPNQQLIPAVRWAFAFLARKSVYLVGSDYVFPRVAHEILKDELRTLGATVVGETFLPLGSTDVAAVVKDIAKSGATMILNTINGDTNLAFFRALRAAGVRSEAMPVLSFSLDQAGYRDLDPSLVAGDYLAWNYFEAFDSADNRTFLAALHERVGPRPATDPMATTYSALLFWAEAVRRAGSVDRTAVRAVLDKVTIGSPLGELRVTASNGHAVKTLAIGQIGPDGKVQVVWNAPKPAPATPYPDSRTRVEWDNLLAKLKSDWGGRWERPQ